MKAKDKQNLISEAKKIFKKYPIIKLVYFFGSQAKGDEGPMSDYDFAVFVDERDSKKLFDLKLELLNKLGQLVGEGKIDVVILNNVKSPELKYNIIKDGQLIYEEEPFRVLVEPKILREYFDFHSMLLRYNLTKSL